MTLDRKDVLVVLLAAFGMASLLFGAYYLANIGAVAVILGITALLVAREI